MAEHNVRAVDLAVTTFAADLGCGFDQGEDAVHARIAERESAAIAVDGQRAAGGDSPAFDKAPTFV